MRHFLIVICVLLVSACSKHVPPPPSHPLDIARTCIDPDGLEIGAEAGAEPEKDGEHYYRRMDTRCGKKHTGAEHIDGGHRYKDGTFTVEHDSGVAEDHPDYSGEITNDFSLHLGKKPGLSYEASMSAKNKRTCFFCIKGYGGNIKINLGKGKQ